MSVQVISAACRESLSVLYPKGLSSVLEGLAPFNSFLHHRESDLLPVFLPQGTGRLGQELSTGTF